MIIKTENTFSFATPPTLTIGFFDGVHLGHQALLKKVIEKEHLVITFQNHPRSLLYPTEPLELLCTNEERLQLLEKAGVKNLLLLEFTHAFSKQSAEEFLSTLYRQTHFNTLILGYDSHLGFQREGTPQHLRALGKVLGFCVEYVEPFIVDGTIVSSRVIRHLMRSGQEEKAKQLLGRATT